MRRVLGNAVFLTAFSVFLITVMNAAGKIVTSEQAVITAVFYRNLLGFLITSALLFIVYKKPDIKTPRLANHFVRSFVGNIGFALIFWAFSLMPMVDVTAILFIAPIIVVVLSIIFLKEKMTNARWVAVILAFLGALVVIRPGGTHEDWSTIGVLVSLGATVTVGTVTILIRDLGKTEHAFRSVFYFFFFGTLLALPFQLLFGEALQMDLIVPLLIAACAGVLSQLSKTQALIMAEASKLSPLQYTAIIWTGLWGFFFFDDLPDLYTVAGSAIIIAANLYLFWAERKRKPLELKTDQLV